MQVLRVLALWLALALRAAFAQEPVSPAKWPGCVGHLDYCAQVIERQQIPLSHGRVRRDRAGLHLRLTSGRTVTVADDSAGSPRRWFFYLGACSALGYYVLWVQYEEGADFRLVSMQTGWSVTVYDMPIVSPDRSRFVVWSVEREWVPTERLQVWRVEDDTLRLEWAAFPGDSVTVPDSVRWLSNQSFQFVRMRAEPPYLVREAVDTADIDPAGHWSTRQR